MTLAQVVTQSVLPDLAAHATPLAERGGCRARRRRRPDDRRWLVDLDDRNDQGQILTGSRMLFALAEHRQLPAIFGRIFRDTARRFRPSCSRRPWR